MCDSFRFQCQARRTSWSHGFSFRWIHKSWCNRINLFFAAGYNFMLGLPCPSHRSFLKKKKKAIYICFAIQGVLTLNCFGHSKKQQLEKEAKGRQRNVFCEFPQEAWAAQNEGKPSSAYEEWRKKYMVFDRSKSSWLLPGALHCLLIDIMSADCLPMDPSSRISLWLGDNSSHAAAPAFAALTSAAGTGSPGESWQYTQPLFLGTKGVSRQQLGHSGGEGIKPKTRKVYSGWLWSKHHAWCSQCGCVWNALWLWT